MVRKTLKMRLRRSGFSTEAVGTQRGQVFEERGVITLRMDWTEENLGTMGPVKGKPITQVRDGKAWQEVVGLGHHV